MIVETSGKWLEGDLNHEDSEGNRAQANMLAEMIELQFEHIANFYEGEGPDQEESENAG